MASSSQESRCAPNKVLEKLHKIFQPIFEEARQKMYAKIRGASGVELRKKFGIKSKNLREKEVVMDQLLKNVDERLETIMNDWYIELLEHIRKTCYELRRPRPSN